MNYKEIWNKIVDLFQANKNAEEFKLQNLWEVIFKELFNYSSLNNEIDTHRSIHLGSFNRVIPDIILRKNNKDIAVIEIKRNMQLTDNYKNQLFSYLKQLKVNVGVLICNKIYLYLYDYTKADVEQKKFVIDFFKDNTNGEKFVQLFNKFEFSIDNIKAFLNEHTKLDDEYKEIKKIINSAFIVDLIKNYCLDNGYNETSISKFLNEIEITIKNKNTENIIQENYNYINNYQNKEITKENLEKIGKNNAISLCNKNGIKVTNHNSTYAALNGEIYPANADPRHLREDWYLLLDDCYNKKLHVFKIPANSLLSSRLAYRSDKGQIVLMINRSFVDVHRQERIENRFAEFKIATFDY